LIHLYVISEAKNLLVEGGKSVSEVAYRLGFENPPYFSRLFKKEVGISPKEFRNQILKLVHFMVFFGGLSMYYICKE
jgi:AraC family transcriptional regulator, transcriptional activator of pobA